MNELLKKLAKDYAEADKKEKESKEKKEAVKEEIVKLVGHGSFKNAFISVSVTGNHEVEVPDIDKMKQAGVWNFYRKLVSRAGSIRVTVKEKLIEGGEEKEPKQAENIEKSVKKSYDSDKENQSKDCSDDTGIND